MVQTGDKSYGSGLNITIQERPPIATESSFPIGMIWVDRSGDPYKVFLCASNKPGDATWLNLGKSDKILENIDVTGDRTLSDTDAFKRLSLIDDGNQTITVPTNANELIPVDTEIVLQGYGTGTKTIEPDTTSVILNGGTLSFVLDSQYSSAVLRKIGTDEWLIVGAVN